MVSLARRAQARGSHKGQQIVVPKAKGKGKAVPVIFIDESEDSQSSYKLSEVAEGEADQESASRSGGNDSEDEVCSFRGTGNILIGLWGSFWCNPSRSRSPR